MPVMGQNMVAASQPLAAQAGLDMMRHGGNAVDAALATAITLTVVEPTMNGIGGDGFCILWDGKQLHGLNASGRSPMALNPDDYQGLDQLHINTNTFIIIATRGHRYDDAATEAAVRSRAGYVGLLGSKRKSLMIFRELHRKGIPEARIREIHAPVGLNIGGRTPEEIAMSIMAEILMCRLGGDGRPMKMDDRLFAKAKEKALEAVAGG